jgi:hypothetical protein
MTPASAGIVVEILLKYPSEVVNERLMLIQESAASARADSRLV